MPPNFAGQIAMAVGIASLVGLSFGAWKQLKRWRKEDNARAYEQKQRDEWVEMMWIEFIKRTGRGSISRALAERHMEMNGWSEMSERQKRTLYGPDYDHDSGELIEGPDGKWHKEKGAGK